jgi:hypothetical protein
MGMVRSRTITRGSLIMYLEVRELYPDRRASENTIIYVLPVIKQTKTLFYTAQYPVYNIIACTPSVRKRKIVAWRKSTGLRVGDEPCFYTPTFTFTKMHEKMPIFRTRNVHYFERSPDEEKEG